MSINSIGGESVSFAAQLSLESEQKADHAQKTLDEKINALFLRLIPEDKIPLYDSMIKDLKSESFTKFFPEDRSTIRAIKLLFLKTFGGEQIPKEISTRSMLQILDLDQTNLGPLLHDLELSLEYVAIDFGEEWQKECGAMMQTLKHEVGYVLRELAADTSPGECIKTSKFIEMMRKANLVSLHEFFDEATPSQLFRIFPYDRVYQAESLFTYNLLHRLFDYQNDKLKAVMEHPCNYSGFLECIAQYLYKNSASEKELLDFIVDELRKKEILPEVLSKLPETGYFTTSIFSYLNVSHQEIIESIKLVEKHRDVYVRGIFLGLSSAITHDLRNKDSAIPTMLECLNAFHNQSLATAEIVKESLKGILDPMKFNTVDFYGDYTKEEEGVLLQEMREEGIECYIDLLMAIFSGLNAEMKTKMFQELDKLKRTLFINEFRQEIIERLRAKLSFEQASESLIKETHALPASIVKGILSEYLVGPSPQRIYEQAKEAFAEMPVAMPITLIDEHLKDFIVS